MACLAVLFASVIVLLSTTAIAKEDVRVLFLTDCSMYSDWQSVAWVFSFRFAGHDGPLTRVMCCEEERKKTYSKDMLEIVETHVAPSFTVHPRTHDVYAAYNKPEAVVDYLEKVTPPEEWLVVLDSDMLLRHPFRVQDYNLSRGWAAGAKYTYMIGVNNPLADRHIPEIPKRNDTFAGPFGRRSDQVGGFFFAHRDDMKRMSKLWLKYTEDVRADPEAWRYTGDVYAVKPGMKPWISEMYGYSYGAAKAGVWHHWDDSTMLYPAYLPGGIPKVLHYGLYYEFQNYSWDKHRFFDFDVRRCPPWDLSAKNPKAGIFQPPPRPSELKLTNFLDLYKDLIAIENVVTLNAGFCDFHRRHCPASEQLETVCKDALIRFLEAKKAVKVVEDVWDCIDHLADCNRWKNENECKKNPGFMQHNCKVSCGFCNPKPHAKHPEILDAASKVVISDEEYVQTFKFLGYDKLPKDLPVADDAQKTGLEGSGQQGAHFAATKTTTETILKLNNQPVQQAGEGDVHKSITNLAPPPVASNTAQPTTTTATNTAADTATNKVTTTTASTAKATAHPTTQTTTTGTAPVTKTSKTNTEDTTTAAGKVKTNTVVKSRKEDADEGAAEEEEEVKKPVKKHKKKKVAEPEEGTEDEGTPTEPEEKESKPTAKPTTKEPEVKDFSDTVLKLLKRCYRVDGLALSEVKACVRAARAEKKWPLPDRLLLKSNKHEADKHEEKEEARVLVEEHVKDPTSSTMPRYAHLQERLQANTFNPFSWQGIVIWVVIVALFIALLPRLVRRKRKSGMRSE